MSDQKRLIDANALLVEIERIYTEHYEKAAYKFIHDFFRAMTRRVRNAQTVNAVEVPCRCCDCYYLLNGKNSFGLFFFCGHKNGLKNLRNAEKDFCPHAKKRMDGDS